MVNLRMLQDCDNVEEPIRASPVRTKPQIVLDMAVQPATGRTIFLLAQSYMPAQEIHVLRNPADPALSPWYPVDAAQHQLVTPEWTFHRAHLRTWLP